MTPTEELDARSRYVEAVRLYGVEHFVKRLRGSRALKIGCSYEITDWDLGTVYAGSKRDAISTARRFSDRCAAQVSELRARIVMARYDAERASVPAEERLADAQAERALVGARRWRKSA